MTKKSYISYSMLNFCLAFLGLPLYLHIPKLYHDQYGLSLVIIGLILLIARIGDGLIDPLLGSLSDQFGLTKKKIIVLLGFALSISFNGFFFVPNTYVELWFAICTISTYFFYSLLFINYYSYGLSFAQTSEARTQLSSFRESFSFLGILTACVLPGFLGLFISEERLIFQIYGLTFFLLILISTLIIPKKEGGHKQSKETLLKKIQYVLTAPKMRFLLILFFLNAMPVAITSNLFNFYIDDVLGAKDQASIFLVVYFLSAAISGLSVGYFFSHYDKLKILLLMMIISAISFSGCYALTNKTASYFYAVCFASGIGLGGELVIFPALAADIIGKNHLHANTFFGFWSTATKVSLALAAGVFLPLLDPSFFPTISIANKLSVFYAFIPLLLKIFVIFVFGYTMRYKIVKVL